MTTADLLALVERGEKISHEQLRAWVVAQAVRNALQTFHGCWGLDPDNPRSGEGFISDGQMRALNIAIRRAVHEALRHADMADQVAADLHRGTLSAGEQEALDFCAFQLGRTRRLHVVTDRPELEEAYQRYVSDPDVNR